MKQHLKLFLLCCLSLCALSACESSTNASADQRILKVAVFNGAYDTSYWQYCAEKFEEQHDGVSVQLTINTNIGNILLPRMNVQDVPDVVYLGSNNNSGYTQKMMQEQRIASLEDVFDQEMKAKFLPGLLDSKLVSPYEDHKLYLAPLYYNVTGLWYNKALLEQYGYELPKTWTQFLALGQQAKEDGVTLFTYQGLTPTYLEALLWPMLAQQLGMEGLQAIFENQEGAWEQEGVKEVLDVFAAMAQEGYIQEDTITLTYTQAQKRFISGEALFLPCGNWLLQEMKNDIEHVEDFGFMSVPVFDLDDTQYATVMVEQIYVPKDALHTDLAKAFIAMQYEREMIEKNQLMSGGYVPIVQEEDFYEPTEPFDIFQNDVIPITTGFDMLGGGELEKDIFEQLSNILAKQQSSQEMIDHFRR